MSATYRTTLNLEEAIPPLAFQDLNTYNYVDVQLGAMTYLSIRLISTAACLLLSSSMQASCGCATTSSLADICDCRDRFIGQQYTAWQSGANSAMSNISRSVVIQLWRGRTAWATPDRDPDPYRIWGSGSVYQVAWWDGNWRQANTLTKGRNVVLGLDWSPNIAWTLGIMGGLGNGSQYLKQVFDDSHTDLRTLGLYGAWSSQRVRFTRFGWYVNWVAHFPFIKGTVERCSYVGGRSWADLHSYGGKATVEVGYRGHSDWLFWQPYFSVSGSLLRRHPFDEYTEGAIIPLCGPRKISRGAGLTPGIRFSTETTTPSGIRVSPEFIVNISQSLYAPQTCVPLQICCTDDDFKRCGPPGAWTTALTGIGVHFRFGYSMTMEFRYNYEMGRGYSNQNVVLEVDLAW